MYRKTVQASPNSTSARLHHGPLRQMTSVSNNPITDSARVLSHKSQMLPADGSAPASAERSVYRIESGSPVRENQVPGRRRLRAVLALVLKRHPNGPLLNLG